MSYLAALPGAVATVVCLAGLRVFSGLVFEPLIASNAVSYGALGTVLIVQSWLIGVGWVVYGGQLFGRGFRAAWLGACVTGTIAPAGRSNDQALRWASVILYLLLRAAWLTVAARTRNRRPVAPPPPAR